LSALLFLHIAKCAPLNSATTVGTPLGAVTGADMGSGVTRFTLPFAQAPIGNLRFANPQPITAFSNVNASATPPQCYQIVGIRGGNEASEDCLYSTFYVPQSALTSKSGRAIPIMVWFHGGSGIAGGSTQAGLDGAYLASSENVIVVYPQYRLGAFGWLQTNETFDEQNGGKPGQVLLAGNQAMRDAVVALQQIQSLAPTLGGDPSRITVMGQSSGALMVRALLNVPSAQSYFQNAILVSDPLDYGLSSVDDNNELGEWTMSSLGCAMNDIACARNQSADDVLNASYDAYNNVPYENPRINGGTPWRPMVGNFVSSSGQGNAALMSNTAAKSVIISSVQNELGSVTGSIFAPTAVNASLLQYVGSNSTMDLSQASNMIFNDNRGCTAATDTSVYAVNETQTDDLRMMFERIGTDGLWRCAAQHRASLMRQNGYTNVYLVEWQVGSTYISNEGNEYCTQNGRVCHEDDIYVIFGTSPSTVSSSVSSAASEMQTRFANFARNNSPTANDASPTWMPVTSASQLNMLVVGADGNTSITQAMYANACAGSLWGSSVQFDWQLYPSP
jgi:carboxylesterase type B